MRSRSFLLAATVAASLSLTACGGGDGGGNGGGDDAADGAGASDVTVVATEFAFDPEDLTIAGGTDVTITVDNQGVVEHDLTVDELDLEIYAAAGTSTSETVNLPAGTYVMYCSIPGHRTSGMEGTLTVTG
jgi:plastocyanin